MQVWVQRFSRVAYPLLLLLGLFWLGGCRSKEAEQNPPRGLGEAPAELRAVSLTPAITETLLALGARAQLVGVSQYCELPAGERLPEVGTALTPNFEGIVRLKPSLILVEANQSAKLEQLRALGPTVELKWHSLQDVEASIRAIGPAVGRRAQADELANRFREELMVPEPSQGPQVLLVMGDATGRDLAEVWFISKNSLHGAVLAAAGGRNAVQEEIQGLPRLSLPRVLELDPEAVVVLVGAQHGSPEARGAIVASWNKLSTLQAVRRGRVRVLASKDAFNNGPGILRLKAELRREVEALTEPGAAEPALAPKEPPP